MRRHQYLAAIIACCLGVYFAFGFKPPSVAVFGSDDVFIVWGWDRIKTGLKECTVASQPLGCLIELATTTASVPGFIVRLSLCFAGSVLAAASFRVLRRLKDAEQDDD